MATIPFLFHQTTKGKEERGMRLNALYNSNTDGISNGSPAKGLWIAGIFNYSGDFTGVEIGAINICENGKLRGVSIGAVNYAKKPGNFSFQIGAINYIVEYKEGTVIQFGLYNRVGNQTAPLINIRKGKRLEDVVSPESKIH